MIPLVKVEAVSTTSRGAIVSYTPLRRKQGIELTVEERRLLNTVIDLIIPADDYFPPPSSLHLIDELLRHLLPDLANHMSLLLSEERLRAVLRDLDISAGGNFCKLGQDKQKILLQRLEQRDPVCFQALWTLVNHSYYSHLAMQQQSLSRSSELFRQ
jgi:hypothetical protein